MDINITSDSFHLCYDFAAHTHNQARALCLCKYENMASSNVHYFDSFREKKSGS